MRHLLILAVFLGGCSALPPTESYTDEQMAVAAAALTKVAIAAEATAQYGDVPQGTSDAEFLALATSHDPSLVASLSAFRVRATHRQRHALVLLCTQDGSRALIEDAGCTAASDRPRWRDRPPVACDFSIDPDALCGR